MIRATLEDHARVAWRLIGKPIAAVLIGLLILANLVVWLTLDTERGPGCYADGPIISKNDSEYYAWRTAHRGECYAAFPGWVVAWGHFSLWAFLVGCVSFVAGLVVRALGLAYVARLRLVVAEREDRGGAPRDGR